MKKILVCQHVPHEPLGTLNQLLKDNGFRIKYANFSRHPDLVPALDDYSGLIILGGPMNVDQTQKHPHLKTEIKLIEAALDSKIPTLGICLGAQLLATALGAEVKKNPVKEVGWYDLEFTDHAQKDPLFNHFTPREKIFQWHGYTFDIPTDAIHLASSHSCPNQAFRYGSNAYGLQFHLEVDQKLIHRWLHVPENATDLQDMGGEDHRQKIQLDTDVHMQRHLDLGKQTFSNFIDLFGVKKCRRALPSR